MGNVSARKRGEKWEYRFEGATIDGKRKQISATSVEALYQKVIGRMLPASNSYNATVSVQDVFNLFSEHNHTPIVDNDGSVTYPTSTAKRKDQYWNKYWVCCFRLLFI